VPGRPPAHGIKVRSIGATWWSQRWIQALEAISEGYSGRLARGRAYARTGRVHDLAVAAGKVTARVTGSRLAPYAVEIALATLSDAAWSTAIVAMSEQARFAAELLAGQMPAELDEAFRAGGSSLFPVVEADLTTACSCPDWANPCKHVAATHYVLGEALDRDPFLLLELRGRGRDLVLDALRAARASRHDEATPGTGEPGEAGEAGEPGEAGEAGEPGDEPRDDAGTDVATVKLPRLSAAEYDQPRAPLPALHLGLDAPAAPGALLGQLGAPASWSIAASPAELLAPLVRAAADHARELAQAELAAEGTEVSVDGAAEIASGSGPGASGDREPRAPGTPAKPRRP
jgi:uncharacterized Zn finger protein